MLALVGVLVPWLRVNISRHERAFWTFLMFLCLGLELNSIYQDRADHRKEEAFARCEQLHSFREIGEGIQMSIAENARGFKETMDRLQGTLDAATTAVYQTRPQSFVQLDFITPNYHRADGQPVPTPVLAQTPIGLNVHYKNSGNDVAQIYGELAKTYVAKPDDADAAMEVLRKFDTEWKNLTWNKTPTVLSAGRTAFFTFSTSPITEGEMNDIKERRSTVYILIRFAYRDKTGDWGTDICVDLQTPATSYLAVDHICRLPDRSRYRTNSRR